MKKISFEDALILNAVKTLRVVARVLPVGVSLFIARVAGALVWRLTKRRKVSYRNLRAAFAAEKTPAELRRIARRSMQNLVMSFVEMLRFPETDEAWVDRHVEVVGREHVDRAVAAGRGVIFLTGHFGNWEILNLTGNLKGFPILALARRQKHPRSDDYLNSMRTCHGGQVIRKGMPIREILRALRQGRIVGIVSDQDAGRKGTFVELFGRLASSASGPAAFAMRTRAALIPIFIFRTGPQSHRIEIEPPLDLPPAETDSAEAERLLLERYTRILESKIRKSPEQWLWAHRRWKTTPDRRVLVLSDGKSGHLNQSLAVVRALRDERLAQGAPAGSFRHEVVEIRFRSRLRRDALKLLAKVTGGRLPFRYALMGFALEKDSRERLLKTYADVVVSCGSSLLAVNLLAKDENHAKSVAVMKPYFGPRRFDAVIAPRHDRMKPAPNVFTTERALSSIDGAELERQAVRFGGELALDARRRRIGLLVGGDTDAVKFRRETLESLLDGIAGFSRSTRSVVLATSSRRTPRWADDLLKKKFADRDACPLLVIANEANRDGVVGGILGLSDVVVVSGESMSMVSEAIGSGKPVLVFMPADDMRLKPKYRSFLKRMEEEKLIVAADPGAIAEALGRQAAANGSGPSREAVRRDEEVLREAVRRVA
ncbi:MAG TPA: ELM1/GtrOC1 family putative glycosyltransferase [Candidatus Eisenbacteria bacterium]|nr:ELM1/GtrOC1 family putative glycosyltransferase [Candidatus Eisenbacteria bacterium]